MATRLDDVGAAEELVQEAFEDAIDRWPLTGVPANPGGWLAGAARRRGIDRLRRTRAGQGKVERLTAMRTVGYADGELLGLIFACAHPALPRESQVALLLRVVIGLTTAELAAAYLVSEATMARRLTRARQAVRGVAVCQPTGDELGERLAEVLTVVYLVFNDGYLASAERTPARRDLSAQALALARLILRLLPDQPEVLGLLALLLLHESRAATRLDAAGRPVRLPEQDRTRWDQALITEATGLLARARELHRPGPCQLQAEIAELHGTAPSYPETDWSQVRLRYDRLDELTPSPLIRLNRAVATRFTVGPEPALREVEALADQLESYRQFHAVRAELLAALGRPGEAELASQRALALRDPRPSPYSAR